MTHDEILELIPERRQGRADAVSSAAVERHLAECVECRAADETYAALALACRAATEHPADDALVTYAMSGRGPEIAVHVATCAECAAIVAAVESAEREHPARNVVPFAERRRVPAWRQVAAAAALLACGGLAGWLATRGPTSSGPLGSGVAPLPMIADAVRGDASAIEIGVAPGQTVVPLALALALPADIGPSESLRVRIEDAGGKVRWSLDLRAGTAKSLATGSETIALLVPSADIPPARYRLVVERDAWIPLLLDRTIVIVARNGGN
jgi:hypothetical protein